MARGQNVEMLRFPFAGPIGATVFGFRVDGRWCGVPTSSLSETRDFSAPTARRGVAAGDVRFAIEIPAMDKRACFERVRCEIALH